MDWLLHLRWLLYQMHAMGWLGRKGYEKHRVRDLRLISRPRRGSAAQRRNARRGSAAQRGSAQRPARAPGALPGASPKAPSSTLAGRRSD
jgi:hypothetical protein